MKTTQVFYEGRVQGVGFRWTAKRIAGSVRNLPDGRVELQVSGDRAEVAGFLEEIRESALAGHITAEHIDEIDTNAPPRGFQITP